MPFDGLGEDRVCGGGEGESTALDPEHRLFRMEGYHQGEETSSGVIWYRVGVEYPGNCDGLGGCCSGKPVWRLHRHLDLMAIGSTCRCSQK